MSVFTFCFKKFYLFSHPCTSRAENENNIFYISPDNTLKYSGKISILLVVLDFSPFFTITNSKALNVDC